MVGVASNGEASAGETDIDPIDAALAAIDASIDTTPVIVDAEVEGGEIVSETTGDAVEVMADEEVVVEAADVTEADPADVDAVLAEIEATTTPAPATKKSAKKASTKAAAPATPAAPKRVFTDVAGIDQSTLKASLDAITAIKVQEKAQNVIQAIETGKKLSRYTATAVKKLVADGKVSGKSLVETFEGEGLNIGTARAQAQQMTALFKSLGLASPDPTNARELVIANQPLAKELMQLAA